MSRSQWDFITLVIVKRVACLIYFAYQIKDLLIGPGKIAFYPFHINSVDKMCIRDRIEHAQMSIYDIKISEITAQYMAYVADMQREDVSIASEFMVLASELLEIKSKMLLPRSVSQDGTEELSEDPRTELVACLLYTSRCV